MKRILPISAGLAMFVAALFLAGLSQQNVSAEPSQGLALQTVLHQSPTHVPAATATPQPTVTPIAGWIKLKSPGAEIWLPSGFIQLPTEQSPFRGRTLLYAESSDQSGGMTVAVVLVKNVALAPDLVPFEVLDGRTARLATNPQLISLGRYKAYRALSEDVSSAGRAVQRLLYSIDQGSDHWVIVLTLSSGRSDSDQSLLEQIARSFSILAGGN